MRRQNGNVDPSLLELMKSGAYFYKHDFGRSKRSRKWLVLSTDGLSLRWRGVGQQEVVAVGDGSGTSRGGSSARGLLRSSSFSRFTTISMADVSHMIYGPYTDTFAKKTAHERVDPRWACFSLVMRENRTVRPFAHLPCLASRRLGTPHLASHRQVDLAAENEGTMLNWLLGLQQLIAYFSPTYINPIDQWTASKLQLQKLRLKVAGEGDRTGHVVLAVRDTPISKSPRNNGAAQPKLTGLRPIVQPS